VGGQNGIDGETITILKLAAADSPGKQRVVCGQASLHFKL
jgi:hypothetical protein